MWNKFEDKKPKEEDKPYLVQYEDGYMEVLHWCQRFHTPKGDFGEWMWECSGSVLHRNDKVIAWMELPEKYKGE